MSFDFWEELKKAVDGYEDERYEAIKKKDPDKAELYKALRRLGDEKKNFVDKDQS